jgi:A/G-specific adenine glycosylase
LWTFPEARIVGAAPARRLTPIEHGFTHFRLRAQPLLVEARRATPGAEAPGRMWLDLADAAQAAVPTPVRRVLQDLLRA